MKKYWLIAQKNRVILAILIAVLGSIAGYLVYARENQVLPQAAIYFLDDVKLPQKGEKVLVFSPHPDDESLAAGGYIYDATASDAEVKIVLVTDGDKHHIRDRRYEEFKKATGVLGVNEGNLIFLGYPDGDLNHQNREDLTVSFQKIIDDFSPDIIIYPSSKDGHPDHAITGQMVEEILGKEKSPPIAYAYLVHARRWPQPKKRALNLYLLPPIKFISLDDNWQKLMLSKTTLAKKQEAAMAYQSQIKEPILRSLMLSSIRQNELFAVEKEQ